jgi:hypothetical protein
MDLRVLDRIDIDGGSYIKKMTFEKCPNFQYSNNSTSVIVDDDKTVIEKVYSKVKYPGLNYKDAPIDYAPGLWNN